MKLAFSVKLFFLSLLNETKGKYLDQRHSIEFVGHHDHFEVCFSAFRHIVHVRLVYNVEVRRLQRGLQLGADGARDRRDPRDPRDPRHAPRRRAVRAWL